MHKELHILPDRTWRWCQQAAAFKDISHSWACFRALYPPWLCKAQQPSPAPVLWFLYILTTWSFCWHCQYRAQHRQLFFPKLTVNKLKSFVTASLGSQLRYCKGEVLPFHLQNFSSTKKKKILFQCSVSARQQKKQFPERLFFFVVWMSYYKWPTKIFNTFSHNPY